MHDAGFQHEALFYADHEELVAGVLPCIREALARDAGVLIALPGPSALALREGLGAQAGDVAFADMEQLGRNPGRIIHAWHDFVRAHADGRPLGIGEPVWHGRSDAELIECDRHETLLNIAFSPGPEWRLLCPYDATRLPDDVLDRARRSHPHVVEHGADAPDAYVRELPGDAPLPDPPGEPAALEFGGGDLGRVRDFVASHAHGLERQRLADLVLAVDELATNTVRYANGTGTLQTWTENGTLLFEVTDGGHIADPLAGRDLPPPDQLGGRGLWLVNQLCDLVQLRSAPGGSTVRVHMRV